MKKISDYITMDDIERFIGANCDTHNASKAYRGDLKRFYKWSRLSKFSKMDLEKDNILTLYEDMLIHCGLNDNTIRRKITVVKEFMVTNNVPLPGMLIIINKENKKIFVYNPKDYEIIYENSPLKL